MSSNYNSQQDQPQENKESNLDQLWEQFRQKYNLENLQSIQWKKYCDKITQLTTYNEEDTIPSLKETYYLSQLLAKIDDPDVVLCEPSVKKYFLEDFFPKVTEELILNKGFRNVQAFQLGDGILENVAQIAFKYIKENIPKLTYALQTATEIEAYYFKNDQGNMAPNNYNIHRQATMTPEYSEWLENLKVGDECDAIKIHKISQQFHSARKLIWAPAKIVTVDEEYFKIHFVNDEEAYDRVISKTIFEVVPRGTHTQDFGWRNELQVGDELDACDTQNVWYRSTILDVREQEIQLENSTEVEKVKEIYVGYRFYRDNGEKNDQEKNKKYFGWYKKYDEWINVTSSRLRLAGYMTDILINQNNLQQYEFVDDTNDEVYKPEGIDNSIVLRLDSSGYNHKLGQNLTLLKSFQNMVAKNQFNLLIEAIEDEENWMPIECLSRYVAFIGQASYYFHRNFAREYVPRFFEAVKKNIYNSPSNNVRKFSKEIIEYIKKGLNQMLRRVLNIKERQQQIDRFYYKIAVICFMSDFLERKIQGLKSFQELLKTYKHKYPQDLQVVFGWIKDDNIFGILYSQNNSNLITRSQDFIKNMLFEELLTIEDLTLIWNGTKKNDLEQKIAIYKVLQDVSYHLKSEHTDFLIDQLMLIQPQALIKQELELMGELTKFSTDTTDEHAQKQFDFLWKFIEQSNKLDLTDLAINKLKQLVRSHDGKTKQNIIDQIIDNIQKDVSSFNMLKFLQTILDTFNNYGQYQQSNSVSKDEIINYILEEKQFVKVMINNFRELKSRLSKKVGKNEVTEKQLNQGLNDSTTYFAQISERISVLHFIFSALPYNTRLSLDTISLIWEEFTTNALIGEEKDILYQWFQKISSEGELPISIEDLIKFFDEKMSVKQNLTGISEKGFKCYQNVFCIINLQLQKLEKAGARSNQQYGQINYTPVQQIQGVQRFSTSFQNNDKKNNDDFEYKCIIPPVDLHGVELLWDLILYNTSDKVVQQAIEFLNSLFTNYSDNLIEREKELRDDYLKQAYRHLEKCIENKEDENKQIRCIQILGSILDESEKKGNGGLKSLTSLIRGEQITIKITNEFNTSLTIPKKFTIKTYINNTILELTKQVGLGVKAWGGECKLTLDDGDIEIRPNDNGKTLADLRIKNGQALTVSKRENIPAVPKAELILEDGKMNPKASKIFHSWFLLFSKNGKMNNEQCAAFIQSCTGGQCLGDDNRVRQVFAQYDSDKDGFLTAQDFQNFYYQACKDRDHVVWSNLQEHNYRRDLLRYDEVEEEKVNVTTLPRYILTQDEEFFNLAFKLLDQDGETASQAWKLVSRLPVSPIIYQKILKLENIRESTDRNWDLLLNLNHIYKLLYSLHVIEYLLESGLESHQTDEVSLEESLLSSQLKDQKIQGYLKTWTQDFISLGGFDHLLKIFNELQNQDLLSSDVFTKSVLSLIIKIFLNYLVPTFTCENKLIFRSITLIKQEEVPLDQILGFLREQQQSKNKDLPNLTTNKQTSLNEQLPQNKAELEDDATDNDDFDKSIQSGNNFEIEKRESYEVEYNTTNHIATIKVEETEQFKNLVKTLEKGLGKTIINKFDFKKYLSLQAGLAHSILTKVQELESEDRALVQYSMVTIASVLLYKDEYLQYFLNEIPFSKELLIKGIFYHSSYSIRSVFNHVLFIICYETMKKESVFATKTILNLLIDNIPTTSQNEQNRNCSQYFELVCSLIDSSFEEQCDDTVLDFDSLIDQICLSIKQHKSQEQRTYGIADKILLGLIQLTTKILNAKPSLKQRCGSEDKLNMVLEVFSKCLFDTQGFVDLSQEDIQQYDKNFVKCKSFESRQYAYNLLLTLCKDQPQNLKILMEKGFNLLLSKLPQQQASYFYQQECRSREGYCGIKNLGAICYMNSMIQQFFMTPSFRNAILMADDMQDPNMQKGKRENSEFDDNVLHQLQNMFGFLKSSDRVDFNPTNFCNSYKDFSGEPVNVGIQQDAQEFLNMCFDKIETGLKETPFKNILDDVYGGRYSNQLICHKCQNVISREEPFMNLSLEVKNLNNIYQSLEKYIQGEIINEYQCTPCNQKVDITKRACLSSLPNVLIVHLQRIIFDLDVLQNIKVNSKLEFPTNLNLEPYTKEGLAWRDKKEKLEEGQDDPNLKPYMEHPQEYYEYKLAGVVVHIGTAEYGHYYSYIDINRDEKDLKNTNFHEQQWLEFNDSKIQDFSLRNLESECFGGISNDGDNDTWSWFRRDNSKNAYMLVYEKKLKDPIRLVYKDEEALNKHMNEIKINYQPEWKVQPEQKQEQEQKDQEVVLKVPYYKMCGNNYLNPKIFQNVWEDNQKFMFERQVYGSQFFKFIREICNQIDLPEITDEDYRLGYYSKYNEISQDKRIGYRSLAEILSKCIFEIFSRLYDNRKILELQNILMKILFIIPEFSASFFHSFALSKSDYVITQLISVADKDVRVCLQRTLVKTINLIINFFQIDLCVDYEQKKELNQQEQIAKNLKKFLIQLYSQIPRDVAKNFQRFTQYFEFWYFFLLGGVQQQRFMVQERMLARVIDFYLGSQKSNISYFFDQPQYQIMNKYYVSYDSLFNVIYQLLMLHKPASHPNNNPQLNTAPLYDFSTLDKKCLYNFTFWQTLFELKNGLNSLYSTADIYSLIGALIQQFCYKNSYLSEVVSITIIKGLGYVSNDQTEGCLNAMRYLLKINDELSQKRREWLLGIPILNCKSVQNTYHYGSYQLKMFDDFLISHESSLFIDHGESVLKSIAKNKKNGLQTSALCVKYLALACFDNKDVLLYILYQQPPQLYFGTFSEYLFNIVDQFIQETRRSPYSYTYNKEEQALECEKLMQQFQPYLEKELEAQRQYVATLYQKNNLPLPRHTVLEEQQDQQQEQKEKTKEEEEENKQPKTTKINDNDDDDDDDEDEDENQQKNNKKNILQPELFKQYIFGKTVDYQPYGEEQQIKLPDNYVFRPQHRGQNQENYQDHFTIEEFDNTVCIIDSKPTGIENISVPDEVVKGQFILTAKLEPDSKWNNFFQTRKAAFTEQGQGHNQDLDQEAQEPAETENEDKQQVEKSNCIRHMLVTNKTSESIHVIIDFKVEEEEGTFLNQQIPKQLSFYISPSGVLEDKRVVLTLQKYIPELPWSKYSYTVKYRIVRQPQRSFTEFPDVYVSDLTDYDLQIYQ